MSEVSNDMPLPRLGFVFSKDFKASLLDAAAINEFGIENLKKVETFKASLIQKIWGIVEDVQNGRQVNGWIVFKFFGDLFDFGHIMRAKDQIAKEYNDLTKEEVVELDKVFEEALKLDDVNMEEFMERTNFMISVNADYISYLSTLKK